jgi:hypothetical protein
MNSYHENFISVILLQHLYSLGSEIHLELPVIGMINAPHLQSQNRNVNENCSKNAREKKNDSKWNFDGKVMENNRENEKSKLTREGKEAMNKNNKE